MWVKYLENIHFCPLCLEWSSQGLCKNLATILNAHSRNGFAYVDWPFQSIRAESRGHIFSEKNFGCVNKWAFGLNGQNFLTTSKDFSSFLMKVTRGNLLHSCLSVDWETFFFFKWTIELKVNNKYSFTGIPILALMSFHVYLCLFIK